ncbi:transcription elongation factor GreB, partial [Xanthomonas perforans]
AHLPAGKHTFVVVSVQYVPL